MTKRSHAYSRQQTTHDADAEQFGIIVHKTQQPPSKLTCGDPLDALVMAISYLRNGYHVLLTDATVEALADDRAGAKLDALASRYRAARV